MKIDFGLNVIGLDGQPIKDATGNDVLFKDVLSGMLLNPAIESESSDQNLKRFLLAKKISEGETAGYSVDELKLLKDIGGKVLAPLAYGRMIELIEGD